MERYVTQGTCSREIDFEVEGNKLVSVKFVHGCAGNTQGVSRLAVGRDIDEVIELLSGIVCRNGTSCPDQLAKALIEYKKSHNA
ncbi:MAG: TIGR03905 family TSCPD domain-containing protein [Clostridiales bacterium]|nr:TIGR03905 family TSCPD domain-containing protein [Clostridiales bacterium]